MKKSTRIPLLSTAVPILLVIVAFVSMLAIHSPHARAVTGSDWQAGNIIPDSLFYDNTSMSVTDIQNFLNNKVPSCDTQGTQSAADDGYPNLTHAQYAAQMGWAGPPYICLKDYMQVPQSGSIVDNYSGFTPPGAISAAQIIKNAADTYSISPKALLTTLQKESINLIFDNWPLQSQYTNAMGYGCPDGAPCDPSYAGFYNQVNNAAWQFNQYRTNYASFRYQPFATNTIYYNPSDTTDPTTSATACGASNVNIQDYATAGLYNYTPFQPDQSALDNLYGTGDSCSAYGNRNFWRTYHDWFMSDYIWQPETQGIYTDSTASTQADLSSLVANQPQREFVTVKVKNIGNKTWTQGTVNLGTSQPQNRTSAIYDSSWLSSDRPATLNEASVAPGDYGTFSFWINTPKNAGDYKEYFNLVADGITWMNDMGLYFSFNVKPAVYTWTTLSQTAYTDATKQHVADLSKMAAGDSAYMSVSVQNTGNTTWQRGAVNFGTAGPYDRSSALKTSGWLSGNRAATLNEQTVAPGAIGTFEFPVRVPAAGTYKEYFDLVAEGYSWMNDIGFYYQYAAAPAQYIWQPVSQSAYTDQTKTTAVDLTNLAKGQRVYLEIKAKNTGNATWYRGNLNLATNAPENRTSAFYDPTWLAADRPTTVAEVNVAPGEIGTFDFWVTAPSTTGTSKEYFNFVSEYTAWLNDLGLYYQFTVN